MQAHKIDEILYKDKYIRKCSEDYYFIFQGIKNNNEILKEAIEVTRDKFDENDTFNHKAITEAMLLHYEQIDTNIYNELVGKIYSNTDLARIVLDGAANGGYSFLLYTLFNSKLKLTEEMKQFAVKEAMNKIGTTLWYQKRKEYSDSLDKLGITNDETVNMDMDGCIVPIGAKAGCEYLNYMFSTLSDELAHGTGEYDIRYHILRNPNWTKEEKEKLVYEFFENDETYDEYLELWEWGIINDSRNYIDECMPCLDKSDLYYYSLNDLEKIYNDRNTAQEIYEEIQFCKMMHELRPQQWELDFRLKK
jgi:hypothetical protein